MNHLIIYLTDTGGFVILNSKENKKKAYEWTRKMIGNYAIFVGWL